MLVCIFRSVLIYFALILAIRLLGKRQLGEMEPSEFVVSLLIADLASTTMQEIDSPLSTSIVPISVVIVLEFILSLLSYHFIFIRKLFCGKPTILIEDGRILQKSLQKTRVTPDELTEHLREQGIVDLSTVKYAILETNGQISALVDPQYQPATAKDAKIKTAPLTLPVTIISNGTLLKDNLKLSGKSEKWLSNILKSNHCDMSQVLLLTVDALNHVYISIGK